MQKITSKQRMGCFCRITWKSIEKESMHGDLLPCSVPQKLSDQSQKTALMKRNLAQC